MHLVITNMKTSRIRGGIIITAVLLYAVMCFTAGCATNPQSVAGIGFLAGDRNLLVVNGLAETLSAIDLGMMTVHNNVMELGKWPNDVTSDYRKEYLCKEHVRQYLREPVCHLLPVHFDNTCPCSPFS